jgi:class 3 adenylate cyclase
VTLTRGSASTTGYIAMADISGYTSFVAATELEHSREILSELLEVTTRELEKHLVPVRLQGDAIICVSTDDEVVACLESAFVAFHRRVRAMVAATTCPCNACRTVPSLTLKFVANYGTYSNVEVRGTKDLVGADVNIAFRLLKNHVPSHEYLLITRAVLDRLPEGARERFVPIAEEYDLGKVDAYYRDLHDLRESSERPTRAPITRADAHVRAETTVSAAPSVLWELMRDPRAFERILSAPHVEIQRGARGTMQGAEYHCHHGKDAETIFEVVGMREPNELTLYMYGRGPEAHGTYHFDPLPDGRTHVEFDIRFGPEVRGPKLLITRTLWGYFIRKGMGELGKIIRERSPRSAAQQAP